MKVIRYQGRSPGRWIHKAPPWLGVQLCQHSSAAKSHCHLPLQTCLCHFPTLLLFFKKKFTLADFDQQTAEPLGALLSVLVKFSVVVAGLLCPCPALHALLPSSHPALFVISSSAVSHGGITVIPCKFWALLGRTQPYPTPAPSQISHPSCTGTMPAVNPWHLEGHKLQLVCSAP